MQTLFLKAENSFLPGKFSLVNSCRSLVMTMIFIGSCEDLASGKINCLQLQFIHSGSKRGRSPITKFISWWVTLVFLLFPKTVDSYRPLQCAASRVFIPVWLQNCGAPLPARLTWTCAWGLSTVTGVQCDTHTHTHSRVTSIHQGCEHIYL